MSKEGLQDPFVPAGKETNKEAGKEDGGHSNGSFLQSIFFQREQKSKSPPLGKKAESAGEEDENEARREKTSKEPLLFGKNPARTHFQALCKAQGRGDNRS